MSESVVVIGRWHAQVLLVKGRCCSIRVELSVRNENTFVSTFYRGEPEASLDEDDAGIYLRSRRYTSTLINPCHISRLPMDRIDNSVFDISQVEIVRRVADAILVGEEGEAHSFSGVLNNEVKVIVLFAAIGYSKLMGSRS
ncbi:hypothetical protein AWU82_16280 [Pseudomonas glycinae]|uniref:Uncharacterized protein n=1 Tax=Pseudomonas glycinae TaxID=1785145 RepID=A0ABM5ZM84_9PSED|nr:hypothetical protein AWU82_16280 [Pseudomonas glycinae]